ncbi:hypothetical protein H2201_008362 [Coniosporium apollinis]|uniref:Cytochrome P450 n=1 Tax=Coniosporium apollinis TaxID=61459 RepID=A0ABQ9NJR3_9PEZI|nr:hypothetical protein H2201_008362 [Coniosporium apollinis]
MAQIRYFHLTLFLSAVWFTYHVIRLVRRAFTGPLSKIPGPLICRFSNLPLKLATLQGSRVFFVDELHQKYGTCVRISPEEFSIVDLPSTRAIHKVGGNYGKSPWYARFTGETDGVQSMFSIADSKEHSQRRKQFSNAFSERALLEFWEPQVEGRVKLAVQNIKEKAQTGGADVLGWFTFMATDVISELAFGRSFKTLEAGEKSPYLHDLERAAIRDMLTEELSVIMKTICYLPIPALQHFLGSRQRLIEYGRNSLQRGKVQENDMTIFSKVFADNGVSANSLSDFEKIREAKSMIIAGTDTTAITLTYLVWAVLKHPEVQQKLVEEVKTLRPDFNSQDARKLRYLSMVTDEALRLYGAVPGGLPRTVPKGGRELGGYFFPEGTVVTTQAYTLHRDPSVFAQPLEFNPERWENPTKEMTDALLPFGAGSRICIGMHLAKMEMALAAATFFRECPTARLSSAMTDDMMELENYFLVAPKGHKCEVVM